MAKRTPSQMYYEDKLSLRKIARKVGIPDHQGAVFHLRNPKTGERELHSLSMSEGVKAPKSRQKKKVASKAGVSKKKEPKKQKTFRQRYDKILALTKAQQMKILKGFGLSWTQRRKLRYEGQRIREIIRLQDKKSK